MEAAPLDAGHHAAVPERAVTRTGTKPDPFSLAPDLKGLL